MKKHSKKEREQPTNYHDLEKDEDRITYEDYLNFMAAKKAHKAKSSPNHSTRKRKHTAKYEGNKSISSKDLPIGLAYFDSHLAKDAFAPITYAPMPYQSYDRSFEEDDSDDDVAESRKYQYFDKRSFEKRPEKDELTTMQSIQHFQRSEPDLIKQQSIQHVHKSEPDPTSNVQSIETTTKSENNSYSPEMVKFTLDDAVVRPRTNRTRKIEKSTFPESIYTPQSSNLAMNTEPPEIMQYTTMIPIHNNPFEQRFAFGPATEQKIPVAVEYKQFPRHRYHNHNGIPTRYVSRQFRHADQQKVSEAITSALPVTDQHPNTEVQIKAGLEKWTLSPIAFSTMKTRHGHKRRIPQSDRFQNHINQLEVSPSYTRQRLQGFSGENIATTPMTVLNEKNHRPQKDEAYITTSAPSQNVKRTLENQTRFYQ